MNIFIDPETIVLWVILLLPVFLSVLLYLYVRYLTSRWYKGETDEEMTCLSDTGAHQSPPPSYIASYQDRLFHAHPPPLDIEKPPDYPSPPSYHASTTTTTTIMTITTISNDDDEEMTLDKVRQNVLLQKQQRLLLPPY